MARIVLVMHAPLASAFAECARHVLGNKPNLVVFDVKPEEPPELLAPQLASLLTNADQDGVLILCDIFGATPFNIAQKALKLAAEQGTQGHVVTGANLCMVLKALADQNKTPDDLCECARLGALKGIVTAD
ncbi:MAG: PTS sugar transporter subunit IIA [Candidimonas sp.]|nr:MAG: PTS sugar transporter subunit IIA [Candidimonas sp.]TAM20850.1 MAG: PTS sugar transporter subunit IIA [Candidimonas sp.]TAM81285.1 MAG: PTS sugar transporter subunit IIA [Candidimonas sp.]